MRRDGAVDIAITGVGIAAPGLGDWTAFTAALAGGEIDENVTPAPSRLLSARERRRSPQTVRLSFCAAEQACLMAGLQPGEPDAIFSSAMGDLEITDYMCRTLAETPEQISPTRFHNSVHNAAAGYWSIGAGATGDISAVSGATDSVGVALTEAALRIAAGHGPVLVVVYDDCAHGAMASVWPARRPFGAALVLADPATGGDAPCLRLRPVYPSPSDDRHPPLPAALEARIRDNPVARILPVLALIAGAGPVTLAASQGPGLQIDSAGA